MQAEDFESRHHRKEEATAAREAAQDAEDARTLTVKRREDERVAQQQQAAQNATAQAQAAQQAEAQQRMDAERQKMQADLAAANEAKARAEADAERQAAMVREQQANAAAQQSAQQAALANQQAAMATQAAADSQQQALQAEQEKAELRARLLAQFNQILETHDSSRGLVVNVGDVLFDTARYSLRPNAREALAKFAGIVLVYPGLTLTIEGHTDSTGTQDFNQKLSEERADGVRDYLAQQGLAVPSMTALGMGEAMPVADNDTGTGRQKNRRVEIIVSGQVIGTRIGGQQ
jgi:outer membrane protein OmpA-like peptidoglycan-associated protein